MIEAVAIFLAVSLIFYAILGGADFGAGIVELTASRSFKARHQRTINQAMGPVWEANHVWLILAIVVLFTAFPAIFRQISITYHIPMTLLLLGITIRGCAFTFRHYDAIKDQSQTTYTRLFVTSSLFTPLMLGMIAGSMPEGLAISHQTGSWPSMYLDPWLNWYAFSVGVFTVCLFGYVASVYLSGECEPEDFHVFVHRAKVFGFASVVSGFLVFFCSYAFGLDLVPDFIESMAAVAFMTLATILFLPLMLFLKTRNIWLPRLIVSSQVAFIILGWFAINFPIVLKTSTESFDIYTFAAPPETLQQLLIALIVGCIFIFPALGYLFYVFKSHRETHL